jgi:hypothetical protein
VTRRSLEITCHKNEHHTEHDEHDGRRDRGAAEPPASVEQVKTAASTTTTSVAPITLSPDMDAGAG